MWEVPDGAQVSCFPPSYALGSHGVLQNIKLPMCLWEDMDIVWPWVTKWCSGWPQKGHAGGSWSALQLPAPNWDPGVAYRQSRRACGRGLREQLLSEGLQLLNSGLGARVIGFGKENHCVYCILFLSHTNFLICFRIWHISFSIIG